MVAIQISDGCRSQAITALTLAERLAADLRRPVRDRLAQGVFPWTGRLIRLVTALAVLMVAGVAGVISNQHGPNPAASRRGTSGRVTGQVN